MAQIVPAHDGWVTSVKSLGTNTGYIVTAGADRQIKIWNIRTFSLVRRIISPTDMPTSLFVLSNGNLASGTYDSYLTIWNVDTAEMIFSRTTPSYSQIINIKQLNDGSIAVIGWSSTIYFLDISSFTWRSLALDTSGWSLFGASLIQNGAILATSWSNKFALINSTSAQLIASYSTTLNILPIEYYRKLIVCLYI